MSGPPVDEYEGYTDKHNEHTSIMDNTGNTSEGYNVINKNNVKMDVNTNMYSEKTSTHMNIHIHIHTHTHT